MMLSKSCEYALRAVVYIALNSDGEKKAGIKEICKTLKMPAPFLAKILQTLVKSKILGSTKGPNGGFYLNKPLQKVSMLDVVAAIDGLDFFKNCAMGLKKCSDEKPCPIHYSVKRYKEEVKATMKSKTMDQVIEEVNDKKAFI